MQSWLKRQDHRVNLPRRVLRLPGTRDRPNLKVPTDQTDQIYQTEPREQQNPPTNSILLSTLVPKPSDRCCFFGKTGAGKTTLAVKLLLLSGHRFAVIDCKHTVRIDNVPIGDDYKKHLDYQIIRPD